MKLTALLLTSVRAQPARMSPAERAEFDDRFAAKF
jgi:hypothetical protein